jgi:hypothetical protein
MNPYSGMVDMAEKRGLLKKEGNSLAFVTSDGEVIKQFRKKWEANENGCLDRLMTDFNSHKDPVIAEEQPVEETE